ncbi:MAG: hypothetical protein PQJ49_07915 [Sphaerochaetaceae bacterium]|nr:hypothetical protein [Sphaerochaetaceae bacterium]MDC7237596.1 hypothetical protein [Sphaerochaetaceae bacterium]MDC7243766.1 hypothetical protein [Sphaerochaetaceae bacterium]MDC7249823.1 hypothetical protein [Sphaerochaetaceae bacterium]
MNSDKEKEIQEALENIKELKSIINNKQKLLRPTLLSKDFISMIFWATLFLILTTIVTLIAYTKYESFWDFSLFFKLIIILSLLGNLIQISIRKIKAINRNSQINIFDTLNDFYSIDFILSVFLGIFFCIIFAKITSITWVYLPLMTILYGIIVISLANPIAIIEFKIMGYLTILIGILSMFFLQVPLLLLALSMYSLILFSYYIVLSYARRVNN